MTYGFKPTGNASYDGTGSLAGRAFIRRDGREFILTLDGTDHELGKKATFTHVDAKLQELLK